MGFKYVGHSGRALMCNYAKSVNNALRFDFLGVGGDGSQPLITIPKFRVRDKAICAQLVNITLVRI